MLIALLYLHLYCIWSFSMQNSKNRRAKGAGRKLKVTPPNRKSIAESSGNADATTAKRDDYESLMLQARVIEATNDITPSANALDSFLY